MQVAHLDDGSDELHKEPRDPQQGGVEVVQEVHDEALDVAAVMVLQSKRHNTPARCHNPTSQQTACY